VGKTVSIACPRGRVPWTRSIQNDEFGRCCGRKFRVVSAGERWNVRYRLGTSTYEFDALTMVRTEGWN
jgi:hypothetical protein